MIDKQVLWVVFLSVLILLSCVLYYFYIDSLDLTEEELRIIENISKQM